METMCLIFFVADTPSFLISQECQFFLSIKIFFTCL